VSDLNLKKLLSQISACGDPKLLRQWIKNGTAQENSAVVMTARKRLYQVLPSAEPGTLEHDIWASIHALEELESAERGKTIRLQRTRNLIADVGEQECVERLLLKTTPSSGYDMLLRHELPELLFEAVALRHRDRFSEAALANARARLP
jgi:hypothetical protein